MKEVTFNGAPPISIPEVITEVMHGVSIVDPYRWLEDSSSPNTRSWLVEQTRYARQVLDSLPHRSFIETRVSELLSIARIDAVFKVGDKAFYVRREAGRPQDVMVLRENDAETILFDPESYFGTSDISIGLIAVSSDANLVALTTREGGSDLISSVSILDVSRKAIIPDHLEGGYLRSFAFSPDCKSFYYASGPRPWYSTNVKQHVLNTPLERDITVFHFEGTDKSLLFIGISQEQSNLVIHVSEVDTRDSHLYLQPLRTPASPHHVLSLSGTWLRPLYVSARVLAMTNADAPNRKIISFDPSAAEPDHWVEIVPETDQMMGEVAIGPEYLVISYLSPETIALKLFSFDGRQLGCIPMPGHGTARILGISTSGEELFFEFSSFSQPPTVYCYTFLNKCSLPFYQSAVAICADLQVRELTYRSKDGTIIPIHLISNSEPRLAGEMPVVLTGYGGFGRTAAPDFSAYSTFLIENGFLLAIPHIRGGGDFGKAWHAAGQRERKQCSFDDFIAAAEWLIAAGYTRPEKLSIVGGSNAGLLIGVALTQRPQLFRVAICLAPLLDMLRYHLFDRADAFREEFGSAEDLNDFTVLLSYSPYHHVYSDTNYPAVLFISGDADNRCNPLHARKMTARLQAAGRQQGPILLDYKTKRGHNNVLPHNERISALTDKLAFLCNQLGVTWDE